MLPLTRNSKGYEFQTYCPWENCKKGILFNRALINATVKCPSCKSNVHLCFPDLQPNGMELIKILKRRAVKMWKKRKESPDEWIDCINEVLSNQRIMLCRPETYKRYRPEKS